MTKICGDEVERLSVRAIRVELQRRGLPTNGLKSELVMRLKQAIESSGEPISVPSRFKRRSSDDTNNNQTKRPRRSLNLSDNSDSTSPYTTQAIGHWMGRSVWVMNEKDMNTLWTISDAYGKGNLSRSAPTYTSSIDTTLTKGKAARQLLALEKYETKTTGQETSRDGIEHLQLTLVEAYHATFHAKRMKLLSRSGEPLGDETQVWDMFTNQIPHFAERFAAYSRYRDTGWMPRSGLKYGVDWVLYPLGARKHSHAPYCIIISTESINKESSARMESTWIRLQNKLRLVKNVAKTLILAHVAFDDGYQPMNWKDAISKVRISEITVDRWVA